MPNKYFLFVVLLLLSACTQNDSYLPDQPDASLRNEALHALMAERINRLFQRIEILAFDQNRTLPELDEDRQRAAGEIALAARNLSLAGDELSALIPALNLSSDRQERFQNLVARLLEASNSTAGAAENYSSVELASSINALQETCADCHRLYRDR
jgi:hypothetical protein